jgi:hypothetical protein
VPQTLTYWRLQKDVRELQEKTKDYTGLIGRKETLKKEYDEVHLRETKISFYQQQKKNPYLHITEIVAACSNGVQLESVKFNKKDVEIEIMCPTAEYAQIFIKRLSASQNFSHVKMISLQQNSQNQQLRCTIKGNVIF